MSEKINIKTVKHEDLCSVTFSGAFLGRINALYFTYMKMLGTDKVNQILPHLKNNSLDKITDESLIAEAAGVETLLILIKELEAAFDEKGLMQDSEIEVPNED